MKYFFLFVLLFAGVLQVRSQTIRAMIVTGGHEYDSLEFFNIFDKMPEMEYQHFIQPEANRKIAKDHAKDFDLIIFYDMWQNISNDEKLAYLKMTEDGMPMLFLHHSIVSYQKWPAFENLLGGRYVLEARGIKKEEISNYEHDVWEYCTVENYTPVTVGFRELRFFDEIYENVKISDEVLPLLRVKHPKSMEYVAWENHFQNSRIVYIQPGHDKRTFQEADYQKLIYQTIRYLVLK